MPDDKSDKPAPPAEPRARRAADPWRFKVSPPNARPVLAALERQRAHDEARELAEREAAQKADEERAFRRRVDAETENLRRLQRR